MIISTTPQTPNDLILIWRYKLCIAKKMCNTPTFSSSRIITRTICHLNSRLTRKLTIALHTFHIIFNSLSIISTTFNMISSSCCCCCCSYLPLFFQNQYLFNWNLKVIGNLWRYCVFLVWDWFFFLVLRTHTQSESFQTNTARVYIFFGSSSKLSLLNAEHFFVWFAGFFYWIKLIARSHRFFFHSSLDLLWLLLSLLLLDIYHFAASCVCVCVCLQIFGAGEIDCIGFFRYIYLKKERKKKDEEKIIWNVCCD